MIHDYILILPHVILLQGDNAKVIYIFMLYVISGISYTLNIIVFLMQQYLSYQYLTC
jgi:hypothetical protein